MSSTAVKHPSLQARRAELRAAGVCVNQHTGPRATVQHGPVVSAGRCQRCLDVKKGPGTPSSVPCPQCGARPQQACRAMNGVGVPTKPHQARIDAAKKGTP